MLTDITQYAKDADNNVVIGSPKLIGSEIKFVGKDNILYCEEGTTLRNSTITFQGSNSVVYLGRNNFSINVTIHHNSVFRIGKGTYINGRLTAITSEEKHIFFGDDCMVSFGVSIRVADPHLIYHATTYKRINPSRSVFIGDHVWIGQSALLLKGTQIGSGSIVGANSVVAGKRIPSNTSWVGNPAKMVGAELFWDRPCVHSWTSEDTRKAETFDGGDRYVYEYGRNSVSFDYVDNLLTNAGKSTEKLDILMQFGGGVNDKNRFAKPPQ